MKTKTICIGLSLAASGFAQATDPGSETPPPPELGLRFAQQGEEAALRPGLRLVEVVAESPADRAGLEPGDVLIRFDGFVLGSEAAFAEHSRGLEPGARVEMSWFRRVDDEWRERSGHLEIPEPDPAGVVRDRLGLEFAVLESKIRRSIISTDTPYGFKISRVVAGSVADDLGLRAGNLLMKWNGKPVRELDDLARWIRACAPGAKIEIEVSRRKQDVGILSRDPWESVELEVAIPADER